MKITDHEKLQHPVPSSECYVTLPQFKVSLISGRVLTQTHNGVTCINYDHLVAAV
jgi:hypothetical protein